MFENKYQIGKYNPLAAAEQRAVGETGTLAVQDGVNFAWKAHSVYSAHSYEIYSQHNGPTMRHPADFLITQRHAQNNRRQVFCFQDGVFDTDFNVLYPFAMPMAHNKYDLEVHKWSYAYVGTKHLFSHPTVERIIWYDEHLDEWGDVRDSCWVGPIFGITQADNRLIVLLEDTVVWSAFDRPEENTFDWYCGVGAQSLALIKYGQPYGVMPYYDGFLTFTSSGVMYSGPQVQGGPNPAFEDGIGGAGVVVFHHQEITFEDLPLGPAAIEHIDGKQVIWLSQRGFYQFAPRQGGGTGAVQPWQKSMGQFYKESIIPRRVHTLTESLDDFALHYARDIGWLFVSSKYDGTLVDHYQRAHVYQFDLDQWGGFNHEHKYVGYNQDSQTRLEAFYGFIDPLDNYCRVDHKPRDFVSWIKLVPLMLVSAENDFVQTLQSTLEHLRVGTSKPSWELDPKAGVFSSWFKDRELHEFVSRYDLLVASGDDSNVTAGDETEYAEMVHQTSEATEYNVHATGTAHSIFFIADKEDYHFDVSFLTAGLFFAGVR